MFDNGGRSREALQDEHDDVGHEYPIDDCPGCTAADSSHERAAHIFHDRRR